MWCTRLVYFRQAWETTNFVFWILSQLHIGWVCAEANGKFCKCCYSYFWLDCNFERNKQRAIVHVHATSFEHRIASLLKCYFSVCFFCPKIGVHVPINRRQIVTNSKFNRTFKTPHSLVYWFKEYTETQWERVKSERVLRSTAYIRVSVMFIFISYECCEFQ